MTEQPSDQEILMVFKDIAKQLKRIADQLENGTIQTQRAT